MTYVKQKNYVQFYFDTTSTDGRWRVWVREFTDSTLAKPVTEHRLIEQYDTAEQAKAAAIEFQSVSNQ